MDREARRLLADDAALLPPSTMDIRAVVRRARRIRRRRRIVASLAGLVAVTVALVLVAARTGTPHRSGRPMTASAAAPGRAPTRFDPMVRTLRVGWRPGGLAAGRVEITRYRQTYRAAAVGADGQRTGDDGLVVSVHAAGHEPDTDSDPAAPRATGSRPTADVAGRPARCLTVPGDTGDCSTLRWEYAVGAYAVVSFDDGRPNGAADAKVARRVAESVSLADGTPVRAPFRLTGVTATLAPTRMVVDPADDPGRDEPWWVTVDLVSPASPGSTVRVTAARPGPATEPMVGGTTNTTVDGRPAELHPLRSKLTVYEVRGVFVTVTVHSDDGSATAPTDPRAVYADVRLPTAPTDPAQWTTPLS